MNGGCHSNMNVQLGGGGVNINNKLYNQIVGNDISFIISSKSKH